MTNEIVRWAIVGENGDFVASFPNENEARTDRSFNQRCTIVKLVGTLPEPPKKPRLMAHAIKKQCGMYSLSTSVYDSEDSARKVLLGTFHSWPAVANAEGYYEVPE